MNQNATNHSATETNPSDPGFGIYIHWPFCRAKCPYCDFNSHVRESIDQDRWCRALRRELDHYAEDTGGRQVTSIYFGGGTPSLMAPASVAAVIAQVAARWRLAGDAEITLEANPTSVEAGHFADYAGGGVNRLSLGVQALDDAALKFLGRQHSAAEALAALALAQKYFPRFSFDLIYARPGQDLAAWRAELNRALDLGPAHLSLYQLTIEENTVFHGAWRRGELTLPPESVAAELYQATETLLCDTGLPAYEISNYAATGSEGRHNLTYWRYGDYVGVGPGAHGRLTLDGQKFATRQHRAPEAWLKSVEENGHATRDRQPVAESAQRDEMVMMGLRLTEGIARAGFHRVLNQEPEQALPEDRLTAMIDAGFLQLDGRGLRATPEGRVRLNAVLAQLLA